MNNKYCFYLESIDGLTRVYIKLIDSLITYSVYDTEWDIINVRKSLLRRGYVETS